MVNEEGTIILDIPQYMDFGLHVYDAAGRRVGTVDDFDFRTGYMTVRPNTLTHRDLYIPFSTITNIDPREVFVSKSWDELHRDYSSPPPRELHSQDLEVNSNVK